MGAAAVAIHLTFMAYLYFWLARQPKGTFEFSPRWARYLFLTVGTIAWVNSVSMLFAESFMTLVITLMVAFISFVIASILAYCYYRVKLVHKMYCSFMISYANLSLMIVFASALIRAFV